MARRSSEGQHQPPADSVSGDKAPSAAAELHIMKIPAGESPALPVSPETGTLNPANRLAVMIRRAGFGVHGRITVPAKDAGGMLATCHAATWALTVIVTLAITVPAGLSAAAVVAILAIELAGFVIGALSLRHRRRGE